jgi:hypothetical protein
VPGRLRAPAGWSSRTKFFLFFSGSLTSLRSSPHILTSASDRLRGNVDMKEIQVEAVGIDGKLRCILLGNPLQVQLCDFSAVFCDKAGVPLAFPCDRSMCISKKLNDDELDNMGHRERGPLWSGGGIRQDETPRPFEAVFGGDLADASILPRLSAASLAKLSGSSHLMLERCSRDSLWRSHFRRQFYRGTAQEAHSSLAGASDDAFRGYLTRLSLLFRIVGGWEKTRVGELRAMYAWRMTQRRKLHRAWDTLHLFLGSRAELRQGLSDLEIWNLERKLPHVHTGFLIPLQVRELYMLANGQGTGWGFHSSHQGIMNGHR